MRTFMKDYVALCKESGRFCKKHWLGIIVLYITVFAAELAWIFRGSIWNKFKEVSKTIRDKKAKKEEKEIEDLIN